MKAAYFTAQRKIEICDVPSPQLTRPDDVLLRIDRVGVCGSDVHYYAHGRIGDQVLQYPATLGHECSGTVVRVGSAVRGLQPAAQVAVDPALSCARCDQCRAGRENTCRNLQFLGCPGEAPGAVAEYHVLPAANCIPIPRNITLDQAVLAEPLSIGLHAVQLANLAPSARIGLFGAGPIGLSVLLCAKATATCLVYVTDLLDERLEAARRFGADWTGNARHQDTILSIAQHEPLGLDVVFECSGDPACIEQAQRLLTPGGSLVLVGIPASQHVSFDAHRMRRSELTFRAVRRQRGCVAPVLQMISRRQIAPHAMLTHRFPLEQIQQAFELVEGYRDGVIKAIIEVSPPI